ncbi:GNAT family N-acetyltransferase [Paraliomyxa miuraensis]|uniref:GNAT family N-acetyltransferase n=1 Tax=Paraliomyxa miuraensis TaxID=376150 RepID=UPI002254C2E5|nr:GNAT family N-acetyltransferase [Paraliomyxa miuraensis]MCX4241831.1 GNAT family N-acetyltransferase [Paraliomyxa miuraensis]
MRLSTRTVLDLAGVDPAAWDGLDHGPSPFTGHGFLRALERSGSVGEGTGWEPCYVLVERVEGDADDEARAAGAARLLGAVACYRKTHSYGEYIFDFGWARASRQAGVPYYPKLVIAAPVTPATGRRLLVAPGLGVADRTAVIEALLEGVRAVADELSCHSVHWLFCGAQEHGVLAEAGYCPRASFQFHWHNRTGPAVETAGYADFDEFLAGLSSRKRKQIRKERRRALEAIDGPVELRPASEWTRDDVLRLEAFYRRTCLMHGNEGYLTQEFFELMPSMMSQQALFARVEQGGRLVAGALFFQTEHALYGRYWGCAREIPFLHFEVAYYAGIEHCIRHGLPLFEAGAQGEHKLLRGFLPAKTYSNHWLRHPGLRHGVERYLRAEAMELGGYMEQLARFSPYRKDDEGKPLPLPQGRACEVGEAGERAAAEGEDGLEG